MRHFALRSEGVETVKPMPPEEAASMADFDQLLNFSPLASEAPTP
jgi:hypothetical protein